MSMTVADLVDAAIIAGDRVFGARTGLGAMMLRDIADLRRAMLLVALTHKVPCIKYGRARRRSRLLFSPGATRIPPIDIQV